MRLGIVLTARCNAACTHCSKSHGPYRTGGLDRATIFRLMDEAAAIEDGEPLAFDLTGGEPFLQFNHLAEVVAYGAHLGAQISCVTNGYWAHDDEVTRAKLTLLRDSGLVSMSVSVSRFHQEFIPLHRPRRAWAIATELGIRSGVKAAFLKSDLQPGGLLEDWRDSITAARFSVFPIMPYLREGACLPDDEYFRHRGLPFHRCPSRGPCVDYDGVARSCCTLVTGDPFLVIGHADQTPLRQIHERYLNAGKQRILRESGPVEFARGAIARGLGERLRQAYAGPCDLCMHIQSDPSLRAVADEMACAADLLPSHQNNSQQE